ncbi:MAG TPA: phage holin family protein [Chthoniobacterales bacterium]|nr:phage holin family protein [Chthoniobacterales bacterium]
MKAEKSSVQQAMERRPVASWASIFLDYFDLKARLLAVESKEAAGHFIGLLVVVGVMLILALCSVLMYGAFLLYLVALLLHVAWGWSALICGVVLTVSALLTFFLLRIRLRKPVFQMTLKDLEKDKEWLTQSKTKVP